MACPCPGGEGLVLLGAAVAIQLAQGRTADELGTMAAFFTVLGDNLALLSVRRGIQDEPEGCADKPRCTPPQNRVQ